MKVCEYLKMYRKMFRYFDGNYNFTDLTQFEDDKSYRISHDLQNTSFKKQHWNINKYTKIIKGF